MLLKKLLPRQYEVTTQIMGGLKVEQHLQLMELLAELQCHLQSFRLKEMEDE